MKTSLHQKRSSKTVRRFLAVLLAGAMLFGLCACAGQETTPSAAMKLATYEIRNVSGTPWVIDSSSDPEYFDDLDAIDASDFMVASGGSVTGDIDVEARIKSGALVELSPTTYRITITCAAGAAPSDEDERCVYLNPLYGQTAQTYAVTIAGVYGDIAVIEWDGASFKQVK